MYQTTGAFLNQNNLPEGQTKWISAEEGLQLQSFADTQCKKIKNGPGGSVCNTIVGLKNLGLNVGIIGTCAQDELGDLFIKNLDEQSIEHRLMIKNDTNLGSGTCFVFITEKQVETNLFDSIISTDSPVASSDNPIKNMERTMATNLGVSGNIDFSSDNIKWASDAQYLLVEGYLFEPKTNYTSLCTVAEKACEKRNSVAITLSADFCVENHPDTMKEFITNYATIVLGNQSEAQKLVGATTPLEAAKAFKNMNKTGAVTCGQNGAYVFDASGIYHIDNPRVANVVDTTGAGDQFAAGFLYEIIRTGDIVRAGQLGSFCAGKVIQGFGSHPHHSLLADKDKQGAYAIGYDQVVYE